MATWPIRAKAMHKLGFQKWAISMAVTLGLTKTRTLGCPTSWVPKVCQVLEGTLKAATVTRASCALPGTGPNRVTQSQCSLIRKHIWGRLRVCSPLAPMGLSSPAEGCLGWRFSLEYMADFLPDGPPQEEQGQRTGEVVHLGEPHHSTLLPFCLGETGGSVSDSYTQQDLRTG